ncbi:SET domain-containing protein [Russula emetica]|nr:SET domain-containing protein [Russula emetica]
MVKIEISQSSVVGANGLRDGEGVRGRGHRRSEAWRGPGDWLARLYDSIMIIPSSDLVDWFTAHNGTFDRSALTFAQTDTLGRGAFALRDLQQGHTLFTLPRHLTLSTRTSALRSLIGEADWKKHGLHIGWAGLILCLMWEAAQGNFSKWSTYLASLPIAFDTPMFWSAEDLEQLRGTAILDKIGKDQAENDYFNKVMPILKSRTDLFGEERSNPQYSLEVYHIMGSRILSRSFQVEALSTTDSVDSRAQEDVEMNLDEPSSHALNDNDSDETEDDEDGDDEDDPANVAMVPLADMMNARYGCENAKLFYEEHHLRMATTRSIRQGEQIWNTYGDPPNSDLLRRYGHVDQVPLANGGLGNPADIVEIRADHLMEIVQHNLPQQTGLWISERVNWWLEEGGDECIPLSTCYFDRSLLIFFCSVFVVDFSNELPEEMASFSRLLMMSAPEWEKTKRKSKLPKPKVDDVVLSVAADVVRRRLSDYPTTIEDDEALLGSEKEKPIPLNLKNAVVVRLGEKRILHGLLQAVTGRLEGNPSGSQSNGESKKRKADGTGADGGRTGKR